jgi:hypothetical protein
MVKLTHEQALAAVQEHILVGKELQDDPQFQELCYPRSQKSEMLQWAASSTLEVAGVSVTGVPPQRKEPVIHHVDGMMSVDRQELLDHMGVAS